MTIRREGFSGWFDSVIDLFGAMGLTPEIAAAVAKAELDPTSSNVQAAINAYTANGQVIPGGILAHLISINEERYPNDTYRGTTVAPMLMMLAGGVAIWYLLKKR